MKIKLFLLCCMVVSTCLQAQEKSLYWLPELTIFENINVGDFKHEGNYPEMKAPATTGFSFGIGLRKNTGRRLFFSWGLGMTFNPQKITYPDGPNALPSRHTERFTNTNLWLRGMLGVKAVKRKNGFFDAAAGVKFVYGLKGKENPGKAYYARYTDEATGKEYNYLIAYRQLNWGDTRPFNEVVWGPAFLKFTGQIAYNFRLKNQKLLRVALDFSSDFGINEHTDRQNAGFESVFNKERERIGKTTFNDQYTHLGINVSLSL